MPRKKETTKSFSDNMRTLREAKGWTKKTLSERSGVQAANLTKIESKLRAGSIEAHLKIAEAFGVPIAEMYEGVSEVKRRVKLETFTLTKGVERQLLVNTVKDKMMTPTYVTIKPKSIFDNNFKYKDIEFFLYVIKGSVAFIIEGAENILKQENSMYIKEYDQFQLENKESSAAELLIIISQR
jgi:transcriptional regulator with XRE-family HTH domain